MWHIQKKRDGYYPFGLEHKGYNNAINGVENNYFTYQGKEYQKELDLNWHDFGARQYDAAIGRWMSIDPVTHHSMSPYNAFDNNPIFWADPSGADAVYNWDDGKYYDNGKEVSFQQALASHELNSDGSKSAPPTKFVNEKGETIADTNDGSNDVYVIKEGNEMTWEAA